MNKLTIALLAGALITASATASFGGDGRSADNAWGQGNANANMRANAHYTNGAIAAQARDAEIGRLTGFTGTIETNGSKVIYNIAIEGDGNEAVIRENDTDSDNSGDIHVDADIDITRD